MEKSYKLVFLCCEEYPHPLFEYSVFRFLKTNTQINVYNFFLFIGQVISGQILAHDYNGIVSQFFVILKNVIFGAEIKYYLNCY